MFKIVRRIFFCIAMMSCSVIFAEQVNDARPGFSGWWCWDLNDKVASFDITIRKRNGVYYGGYGAVATFGKFIDDNAKAFSFRVTDQRMITTTLKAGWTGRIGLIQLKILPDNKLRWRVIKYPSGNLFVPREAIMSKCKIVVD